MGRPKGSRDTKARSNVRQAPAQKYSTWQPITPEEVATSNKSLEVSKRAMLYAQEKGKVDFHDADAVMERFVDYVNIAQEIGIKPNLVGTALAMGVTLDKLSQTHSRRIKLPQESYEAVDNIYTFLNSYLEGLFADGDIPTVNGIFLFKNHYGYKDQQEVVVAPTRPLGDDVSEKSLEEKYAKSVPQLEPIEATEYEVKEN